MKKHFVAFVLLVATVLPLFSNATKEKNTNHDTEALYTNPEEWSMGKPDLILKMQPFILPASGKDIYQVFVLNTTIPKGTVIKALDFKPGNTEVVHHATIFLDYTKTLRKYDEMTSEPGYNAFEYGGTMEFGGALPISGWAPGMDPVKYPQKVGFYVEQNAELAFEIHYHLTGEVATDESYIGVYFDNEGDTEKLITGSLMGTQRLQIPANDNAFTKTIWTYVPADIELYSLTPHMHYIGKEVIINHIAPNGTSTTLLYIDDWNLEQQNIHTFPELMRISKGSIIEGVFTFDNSEENFDNPYFPPQEMYWGWESNDEMCELYLGYIPINEHDYGKMLSSSLVSFEHTYPFSQRVIVTEQNIQTIALDFIKEDIWSEAGKKILLSIIESGLGNKMLKTLDKLENTNKNNPNFYINYAQLLLVNAYMSFDEEKIFRDGKKVARILHQLLMYYKGNWNATFSYGKLLIESAEVTSIEEGVNVLKELLVNTDLSSPKSKYALLYWELGKYYYSINDNKNAELILQQGLKHYPNHPDLNQEFASGGRIVKRKN